MAPGNLPTARHAAIRAVDYANDAALVLAQTWAQIALALAAIERNEAGR